MFGSTSLSLAATLTSLLITLYNFVHCSIRAIIHEPVRPDFIWRPAAGIRPGFYQQSLRTKTIWQPNNPFRGTDWKLAFWQYIYWCIWAAAIHPNVWHPVPLSVWELHPSFRRISHPAFGATSSTFGSGSVFGQKTSFGAFGSSPSQSSPFGSTFQQTQPAFGSNAFGATSTPGFGTTTTPAFGATTAQGFGTTTTPGFGASTTPTFGSTSTSLFGTTSAPTFGSTAFGSSTPGTGFGTSGTTTFGVSSGPGFGVSSTPTFGFGSSPSVGQTSTSFGTSLFGANTSPFGAQTSTFGSQPATTPFGQAPFGNQAGGSRIKPYAQTLDADSATSGAPAAKLDSISAMPEYKDKSHDELRWEDYQRGDKGGPNSFGTPAAAPQPNPQPNLFAAQTGQVNPNPFSSTPTNNPFAAKTSTGFGSTSTFSTLFNSSSAASSNPFTSSTNTTQTPSQSNMVMQPAPVSHPYGTLPAMPQMSIGNVGSSPSVQYGISSLPVAEKPLPSRTLSMVVPRHLSQRRIKLHPRKYNPISDGKKTLNLTHLLFPSCRFHSLLMMKNLLQHQKRMHFFVPRENPRNLIIRPIDQWPSRSGIDRRSVIKDSADLEKYKGASVENERSKASMSPSGSSPVENGSYEREDVTRHGNGASVGSLMPKLPDADYSQSLAWRSLLLRNVPSLATAAM
ncbi:hypothetical protein EJB05_14689 [Eragrostis curvula]|uniref:Uncharacterized protein n=1 Tax=Eragrostis curvula TaxID=38414 RepID=A0A5J9W1I3_9POAL|nr:hypothetical protein EJB05_14689 [Eragrostis curvula]